MRRSILSAAILLASCLQLEPQGGGEDDAGSALSSSEAGSSATGIDCITEPTTGATLCTGISTCPDLLVNHDTFPTCGFRPGGTVLDLECSCTTSVCPIGVATSCDDARRLMNGQSQWSVCNQEFDGRCTAGQTGTTKKTCDQDCLIRCVDEGCPKRCGCAN